MLREHQTEVLVVGAGPVGMLTALLLSQAGVRVRIIDQESRTASRTYACALHPRDLKMLDQLDIARDVLAAGHLVEAVAFYQGKTRAAEVKLGSLAADFPFVAVLPQSTFEQLLEERLRKDGTVQIGWNHQLSGLEAEGDGMVATVDVLGVSAKGYIVPEMEWSVEKTETWRAAYVVGADGPNSMVAQTLKSGYDRVAGSEFYAVYEVQTDWEHTKELRVVLDQTTTSVLWPLRENKVRWSFQLLEEHLREFPSKERTSIVVGDPALDRANRVFVERLLRERAPWFNAKLQDLGWSTDVEFEHRVAKRFGRDRRWLAGDAAHQTGPAGMQSMNLGLLEAERLSGALIKILREHASSEILEDYHRACLGGWRRLLELDSPVRALPSAEPWVRDNRSRILSCLPASGDDLDELLKQLRLGFQ